MSSFSSAMLWSFIQRFGSQAVEISVSILLARILLPEEFGLIGMIMIVVVIGRSLTDAGMTSSLIRKIDASTADYSTVFYLNVLVGLIVYGIVYLTAPFIAVFYEQPVLTDILRVFALTIVINSFSAVQSTIYRKKLLFKFQFRLGLTTSLMGGALGVYLAQNGYGVWSLVFMHVANASIAAVLYWIFSSWKPKLFFSKTIFKEHFKFGINLTLSGIINKAFDNIYYVIIGKYFNATQLGYYTRADTFKQIPITNLIAAVNNAAYPILSSLQNDQTRLKSVFKRIMKQIIFLIAPVMIGAIVLAEPLFRVVLTEKWIDAVPFFQVLCLAGILYPVHSYNLNILTVKGRSDLFMKLEVIKKVIMIVSVVIAIPFGIMALLYSQLIISVLILFINAFYSKRFIDYGLWEQVVDILPSLLIASFMGAVVFVANNFLMEGMSDIMMLVIGISLGASVFTLSCYLLKLDSFFEFVRLLKVTFKRHDTSS